MSAASLWRERAPGVFIHPKGYRVQSYMDGIVPRWSAFHPSHGWIAEALLSAREAKERCRQHALEVGYAR